MWYTPLWKSNRNFFSTQFFYHLFFVVCFSFYTWYMWGGQYKLCKFLLDFDHWLYLSDILKKVTGSKPDVALVWFMQWAKMELEHGEKDRYWCIVRVQEVRMKVLQISENLSSRTSRLINGLLWMLRNWGKVSKPLAGRLLHQPPPCGLSLLQQRSKQRKLELCKGLAGFPSAKRAFADFWTAHIVQSGL